MSDKNLSNPNHKIAQLNLSKNDSKQKSYRFIEWTIQGKLLVLFAANLIWWNHMINAVKVIENYGFKLQEDPLALANIHLKITLSIL